jgi:hypothetical protein
MRDTYLYYASSSSLTWSFKLYLAKSKSSEALHCAVFSNTLFSDTLSLCSSLRDKVSLPDRTTSKIIVLYILIFMFLDSRQEDKRSWTEW